MRKGILVSAVLACVASAARADNVTYQRPVKAIANFVDAPPVPRSSLGPDQTTLVLATPRLFPSIAEVSEPELHLAGVRLVPRTHAAALRGYLQKVELLDARTPGATPRLIQGFPDGARIADLDWSPDGKHLAFTVTDADAVRLWIADPEAATARPIATPPLSAVIGRPCSWLSDSRTLACRLVPSNLQAPPAPPVVPTGPVVQENAGTKKPAVTNPDLLANPTDELRFEYYVMSQVALVGLDGKVAPIGPPALYSRVQPSPDGRLLLVTSVHRPFSYRVAIARFPTRTEVWGTDGKPRAVLADLKLAEEFPIGFDAVRTGRRAIDWRADAPATACWAEALDGGDPKKPAAARDEIACAAAPFDHPATLARLADRFQQILWGTGKLALITDTRWTDRHTRTSIVAPDAPATKPRVLWDRSSEDRYTDPGEPVMRRTTSGSSVLQITQADQLLLTGDGASDQGDQPFFDRLDLATGKSERVWRSQGARYETIEGVLDQSGGEVIESRESPTEPPQLFAVSLAGKTERQLTHFSHPVPELAKVKAQLIKWKRKDGLELSGMLYLPPGFRPKQDHALPVLVWVYPQEFKSASAASQVDKSPYRFVAPWWGGPLFALTQGYAVVDDPKFAIIGEGKAEPNDTYVDQLTSDAAGMIDAVVQMGVGDRDRFAVGGHSYGAFTTVNLLAHSKLFRAGIARSGAYNRTLTPFGFQAEERTYWQAAATYDQMSPFRFADKIDAPLLMIHGAADNNTGTFPIQSERLFAALQGLGARVRYLVLPAEAHGYRARESALHVLWEQARWLDANVKNAPARPPAR